jgi:hypothetical protein
MTGSHLHATSKDYMQMGKCQTKIFPTEPKLRRHMSDLTPTRKRAALLMELLFRNNFTKEAPYETIYRFIEHKEEFIGLDERTITRYIGRPKKS